MEQVLDGVESGPSGVALEGPPGVGKTTIWREAVEAARRREFAVISTAPAEPDTSLAFSGLGDLVADLAGEVDGDLPGPQRRALAGALLLEDQIDAPVEPQALSRAILTLLQRAAARGPLVIAIDDEQWLDPASAGALAFALCRLREERIGVLLARRSPSSGELWPALSHGFAGEGLESMAVEPLSFEASDQLVTERLGRSLSRTLMRRVYDVSGGNPLFALAIARELRVGLASGVDERDLPVPASLTDALAKRLQRVDDRTGDVMLAVAATSAPTVALLQVVIPGFSLRDLDVAVQAGLLEIVGDRVRFSHPLLASTHYTTAAPSRRREVHRLLADAVDDEVERAYHLARGAESSDRVLALTIEHAAGSARRRGAPLSAAALLEDAARLTPFDAIEARRSRMLMAAEQHNIAGDIRRSRELLEGLVPELERGPMRARALAALAEARMDDLEFGLRLLKEALEDAGDHPRVRSKIESSLAAQLGNRGSYAAGWPHVRAAVEYAELAGDPVWLAIMRTEQAGHEEQMSGLGVDRHLLEDCMAVEDLMEIEGPFDTPSFALGRGLFHYDDFDAARPWLERALQWDEDHGAEAGVGIIRFHLMGLEWWAGNREAAESHRLIADRILRDQGIDNLDAWLAWAKALFALDRGELVAGRAHATEAVGISNRIGDVLIAAMGEPLLASAELWLGEPAAAHDRLHRVRPPRLENGLGFLGSMTLPLWSIDIEALIALGRLDEAEPVLNDLLARAQRSGNPNAVAVAERCRGLLLAARGEVAAGIDAIESALVAHEQRRLEPEVGRTLLELGTLQRRAKHKSAAKQSLEQALAIFEPLGAAMWVERARDELGRIGLRRAVVSDGLTPAQERVAELVATGMSNREIASTLYMSLRSVESHLTKVYRELGVRSRAQLAASLAAKADASDADRPPTETG